MKENERKSEKIIILNIDRNHIFCAYQTSLHKVVQNVLMYRHKTFLFKLPNR